MTVSTDTEAAERPATAAADGSDGSSGDGRVRNAALVLLSVALVLGILAVLAASNRPSAPDWRGRVLPEPEQVPDIRLTDTEGRPFSLRDDTTGDLTLLMFGYTNCPDICPISLGTLAASLQDLGNDVANRVDMVFVTADPARDTPEVLRQYLDGYSADFIGLRGTPEEVAEAQDLADVPRAEIGQPDEDGEYEVGHATQMIAYQSDGTARIVYPFGTRSEDWKADLPRLLDGEVPVP
ncbi:MAG: SCO family protein [Microthrixaceae bacterium]